MWLFFVISCSSHCEYLSLLIGCYNVGDQSTWPRVFGAGGAPPANKLAAL